MASKVTAHVIDMTNVADSGQRVNPKRMTEGDYLAKVISVEDAPVKNGDNKGAFQWLFIIQLEKTPSAKYPYYCQLTENQLWKIRNLLVAAGINVPKKKVKLDPEKVIGRLIAISLEDDEYEGKLKSTIGAIFPASELGEGSLESSSSEDDDDDSTDDDAEEATTEDEDEEETSTPSWNEIAELDRTDLKQYNADKGLGVRVLKTMSDDDLRAAIAAAANIVVPATEDDEDEEEEAVAAPAKKRAAKKVTDDELEELDIEDV